MTPPPVDVEAALTASWIFMAVAAVFFVFSLAWAMRESGRTSDALPLLALLGGVIASLEEPWINVLIQLWYPENSPLVVYTGMGHHQPLYLHLVYPGFVGLGAYVVYRGLLSNPDGWLLWRTFLGIAVLDLVFEGPATAAGVYAYYGAQPFQLFSHGWPAWVAFVNAAGPVLGGWLIFRLAPRLVGRQRLLLTLIPPAAYAAVYGAAGWPTYTMLKSDVPEAAIWAAATATIAMCFVIVRLIMATLPAKEPRVGLVAAGGGHRTTETLDG